VLYRGRASGRPLMLEMTQGLPLSESVLDVCRLRDM
jgi:hypothetical protein